MWVCAVCVALFMNESQWTAYCLVAGFICDYNTYVRALVKLKRGTKPFWLNNWHRSIGISCAILGWKAVSLPSLLSGIPKQCNAKQKSIASISKLFCCCHSFNSFFFASSVFTYEVLNVSVEVSMFASAVETAHLRWRLYVCYVQHIFSLCLFLSLCLVLSFEMFTTYIQCNANNKLWNANV